MRVGHTLRVLGVRLAVKKKIVSGGRTINVGIYGKINVISNHPAFHYDLGFCCEPPDNEVCESCKFKFKCFTDEEIDIVFNGKTIGIFPPTWCKAEPDTHELEIYLFGKKTNLITLRSIPSNYRKRHEDKS